ncbi:uncharacterized protein TNCV_1089041 [Trichonephila clavipes]|uniref:Uncharacterized protein n=1 Tax=Trichonephila clavipes TaxID=2585209 RepID=A0A8X6SSZ5_TRICX|nr:uncharacterized protein TNCV_1089041 [Trichonephila clavipes]
MGIPPFRFKGEAAVASGKVISDASAVPLGLDSNPGEDMDVCRGTLNNRGAASPLVRLVEGEERWEAPDHPQGILPQN